MPTVHSRGLTSLLVPLLLCVFFFIMPPVRAHEPAGFYQAGNQPKQFEVSGIITDAGKAPLMGVSVTVKGSSQGTVTDSTGAFRLLVPDGTLSLVISSVGYTSIEVAINNQAFHNITLGTGSG
jgi:hypothetical protein